MGVRVFLFSILLGTASLAGCVGGPSAAELATAKSATYTADPQQLLARAVAVAEETYKIQAVDQPGHRFVTAWQWYSAEGDRESPGAEDRVQARGGSVNLQLAVEVVEVDGAPGQGAHYAVRVTPKTYQLIAWSPQPRELAPDDPNLPPWIHGRADNLAYAIHQALAKP